MKTEIIPQFGLREDIHPHNDTLKMIDLKIHRLIQTLHHIRSTTNPTLNQDRQNIDKQLVKLRIDKLKQSKAMLLLSGEGVAMDYESGFMSWMQHNFKDRTRGDKRVRIAVWKRGVHLGDFDSIAEASDQTGVARSTLMSSLGRPSSNRQRMYKVERL